MDYKKILMGLLSKTHKMTKEELTELIHDTEGELKEDALSLLVEQDKTRIGTIKDQIKFDKDEIFGRAKREVLSNSEKQIKDFFGVKSDKKGDDLFNEIKSKMSDNNGNSKITDEDVKNHSLYQKVLTTKTEDIAKLTAEYDVKIKNFEKETNQKNIFSSVSSKALSIVKGLKPVLSDNPERAEKQLSMITKALKKYEFEKDGDKIIVKENGKIIEDDHANQITFGDLVKGITGEYFDLDASQERSGTGNDNNGSGAKTNKQINSKDDLREKLKNAKSPEEKQKAIADYNKSQEEQKK